LDDWLFERLFLRDGRPADEAVWPIVVALVEMAPDDAAVGAIAAGPLEDLATNHGAQFGDRLVGQTRTDPRFRKAMRGILGWEKVPEPHRSRLLALLETPEERQARTPTRRRHGDGRDRGQAPG
jgi:hypothetical protein